MGTTFLLTVIYSKCTSLFELLESIVVTIYNIIICYFLAEAWITFGDVTGKCFVTYQENLLDKTKDDLMKELPHQFYFAESYDASRKTFIEPPLKAQNMGRLGKAGFQHCISCMLITI